MDTWLWIVLILAGVLTVSALAAAWLFYTRRRTARDLLSRIGQLPWRAKVQLAGYLFRDPRVPVGLRVIMPLVALYLILPIDLIPDFIPVIGQIDDLILIVLVAGILLRAMPVHIIEEHIEFLEHVEIEGEAPSTPGNALPPPSAEA